MLTNFSTKFLHHGVVKSILSLSSSSSFSCNHYYRPVVLIIKLLPLLLSSMSSSSSYCHHCHLHNHPVVAIGVALIVDILVTLLSYTGSRHHYQPGQKKHYRYVDIIMYRGMTLCTLQIAVDF